MQKLEKVELTVLNRPGVLVRVAGRIRREGWNIKSLNVDESEDRKLSRMQIYIEGTHTKLAQIVDRLLGIDCVVSVSMTKDNETFFKSRPEPPAKSATKDGSGVQKAPKKAAGIYRILTINPGSTSTKFAIYDDERLVVGDTINHDRAVLDACGSIFGQKELRLSSILDGLKKYGVELEGIDAIAGRGGLLRPIVSGTYMINDLMIEDLSKATAAVHASALGAIIARELADKLSIPSYVVDPIVVDEMDPYARITGMPGIARASVFHALNQKAVARRLSKELNVPYENARMVVAHLGGGITVGAHRYGRVIDVNDAISGEGPFTPERTGQIPAVPLIKMCFSGEYTEEELLDRVMRTGGMQSYLGTNSLKAVQKMIDDGDEFAGLVMDSMAYQVSKEIGAMTAVLEGRVDAIILTGGLAFSDRFTGAIKQRVDRLAPVYVYPGEDEMLALMEGVLLVLRGEERALEYECG